MADASFFAHGALLGVGCLLAALIARAALVAHRTAGSPALLRFAIAFALFSLSQAIALVESIHLARAPVVRASAPDAFDVWFWSYYASLVGGWGALLSSFDRPKLRIVLAIAPLLLFAGPILQLCVIVLGFLVVLHAGLNHIERARPGSLRTALGFALLFAAQCLFLLGYLPLAPRNVAGEVANVLGLALLYIGMRSHRGGQ